jgi:hypothetical protein
MIDCLEFRRRAGAEPFGADAGMEEHRHQCAACARHHDELRAMDDVIRRALAVDPAARKSDAAAAPAVRGRGRLYAIAASLVAGIAVAFTLLVAAPRASIAREVFGHMGHEPGALQRAAPLAPADVAAVIGQDGMRLHAGVGDVTYAMRCVFDGHVVPHLVVQTPDGPVTVLVLRHRKVVRPMHFQDERLEGVVLPAPRGSIAVVGQDVKDLRAVAERVVATVDWDA